MVKEIEELDTTALEPLGEQEKHVRSPVQERREWLQNAFKKKSDANAETAQPTSPGRSLVQDRHKWISSGIGKTEVVHKINPDEIDPAVVEDRKKWLAEKAKANALRAKLFDDAKQPSSIEERNDLNSEHREFSSQKGELNAENEETVREKQDAADCDGSNSVLIPEEKIKSSPIVDEPLVNVEESKLQLNQTEVKSNEEPHLSPRESPKKQSVDPPATKKETPNAPPATPAGKGNRLEHDEHQPYTIEKKESVDAPASTVATSEKETVEDMLDEFEKESALEVNEPLLENEVMQNTSETNGLARATLSEMPSDERLFITKSNSGDNWQSKNPVEAHCLDSCAIL